METSLLGWDGERRPGVEEKEATFHWQSDCFCGPFGMWAILGLEVLAG